MLKRKFQLVTLTNENTEILLDADVIRHFIKGNKLHLLPKIYPSRLLLLDIVEQELSRSQHIRAQISGLTIGGAIGQIYLPLSGPTYDEFTALLESFDEGESACMAYARYNKNILASSNLKDVKGYCLEHHITLITTMDILVDAFNLSILNEEECNDFIKEVLRKNSKLPCNTIQEYLEDQKNNVE